MAVPLALDKRGTRLLAHERIERKQPDLVYKLREEILTVIGKHGKLDPPKVQVTKWTVAAWFRALDIDVELPNGLAGVMMPSAAA